MINLDAIDRAYLRSSVILLGGMITSATVGLLLGW
jgi:hypothetical protein